MVSALALGIKITPLVFVLTIALFKSYYSQHSNSIINNNNNFQKKSIGGIQSDLKIENEINLSIHSQEFEQQSKASHLLSLFSNADQISKRESATSNTTTSPPTTTVTPTTNSEEGACDPEDIESAADSCAFVRENCPPDGYINYLAFHYCTMNSLFVSYIFMILWCLFIFWMLGSTAEQFFCPALMRVSKTLRLSPNVAGVTFLAFGNGAPDIFSAFSAVNNGLFPQAIGELLGAGFFITTVVVSSITIFSSVPVVPTRRPFLRDVAFYLGGVILIFIVLFDHQIELHEGIILVLYYISYVTVVFVSRFIYQRRKKIRRKKAELTAAENVLKNLSTAINDDESTVAVNVPMQGIDLDDEDNPLSRSRSNTGNNKKPVQLESEQNTNNNNSGSGFDKLADALKNADFGENENNEQSKQETDSKPNRPPARRLSVRFADDSELPDAIVQQKQQQQQQQQPQKPNLLRRPIEEDTEDLPVGFYNKNNEQKSNERPLTQLEEGEEKTEEGEGEEEEERSLLGSSQGIHTEQSHEHGPHVLRLRNPELLRAKSSLDLEVAYSPKVGIFDGRHRILMPDEKQEIVSEDPELEGDSMQWMKKQSRSLFNRKQLAQYFDWDEHNRRQRVFFLFLLPIHILRHFSIPCLEEGKYMRLFTVIQPFGISLMILFSFQLFDSMIGEMPAWILVVLIGVFFSIVVFFTSSPKNHPPPYYVVYIFLGIFMAVVWIYAIANELVSLLSAAGKIFDVSDAIMGITVLAWGNSIGDLIANSLVARQGIPQMGLGAAFAAPFCNTLLGLGISLTYYAAVNGSFQLVDKTFLPNSVFFALVGLIVSLSFSLIVVPLSKFTYRKIMVPFFVSVYVAVLLFQLLSEFGVVLDNTNLFWISTGGKS